MAEAAEVGDGNNKGWEISLVEAGVTQQVKGAMCGVECKGW